MRKLGLLIIALLGYFITLQAATPEKDLWQLRTSDFHADYVGAPVANGGIGILPWKEPFSVQHVILNHVFDTDGLHGVSRVLKGINPFLLTLAIDGNQIDTGNISAWQQTIDMKEATHNSRFIADGKAEISYSICALRNMPYAGLIRVEIKALSPLSLKVTNRMEIPEEYNTESSQSRFRTLYDGETRMDVFQTSAYSKHRKVEVAASSAFLFDNDFSSVPKNLVPAYDEASKLSSFTLSLKKGETFSFALAGSICSQRDFTDPYNESERQVIYAIHEGIDRLMNAHRRLWDELWQSDIRIEGDDDAQRTVRFALFNLYSFARAGSGLSISPMGLSSQGYNGHIFWDTELWMYPPMLLLNQGIAESMINYRTDRLPAALKRANSYGYRGAMFPWESDDAGEESTPTFALTGPFEHHITADIAIACWQYYCITHDLHWLQSHGYPLMKAAAEFWVSRAERNTDGSYSIRNVVGADEYASGADDNAFTNGAAIRALEYACIAAEACGFSAPSQWKEVGKNIRILTFPNGVTREHATYNGEMIKQADANLLAYPLGIITNPEIWKKDMEYYADKIDPKDGPAMSYSVFCVQYARMGDAKKAYEMFRRCFEPNLRAPFGVLAETATSNNPYFATGAGGLLQAVINGFCGLQVTEDGIIQVPSVLPKHWKKVTITGVGAEKKTFGRESR